ncbi:glycosyl transferase [Pandoraea communis]|uniref:Glycosyl transferase n=1 Tax=Pandoraea communis TaxID=2508297 RepID=A0A5E4WRL3_9BURK|nr:glycosyltransferase [Pandoraea communis]VVE27458.1 glycosyl transferase [Pandoraea communis]
MFSIIVPTWNNLALLQLCVRSIRQNSRHQHQIIVHVNDGSDGSLEWVRAEGIEHTASPDNIGICYAVNQAAALAREKYIVYLNDDMYCCPGWDSALIARAEAMPDKAFMLSGTMIEPVDTHNPCVLVHDFGRDVDTFDEAGLLAAVPAYAKPDWLGATWPPTLVHRDWWFLVGGYSTELSPGMSSDNDFSMKMWAAGARRFVGVGASLVYHFQCKSTGKVVKNDGRTQFLRKWGMTQSIFDRYYLRRGKPVPAGSDGRLPEPVDDGKLRWELFRSRVKRALAK